jgi:pyrroline-5-carboxylate reductase
MSSLESCFSTLGFLGAGNMAGAILRGTVGRELLPSGRAWACDVLEEKLAGLNRELGIQVTQDPRTLVANAKSIVLAVKPQDSLQLLDAIRDKVTPEHLIISIVAGKATQTLGEHLPEGTRIVRVMPNTPALIGTGAAGVAAGKHATAADLQATLALFGAVGIAYEVKEQDLDAVTALSGSGPAYVFRFMEIMVEAGVAMGLKPEVAEALTLQTVLGAAQLAIQSSDSLTELRRRVTSPGGTTAAALAVFEEKGLADVLIAGLLRARDRSIELSQAAGH